mmetsp:Transcript_78219/g.253321  ORF Transcript_78219/g.253321 Transcript_78219/m.253321 type:complete len:594 (+) Transcript_78219:278-2059(+)
MVPTSARSARHPEGVAELPRILRVAIVDIAQGHPAQDHWEPAPVVSPDVLISLQAALSEIQAPAEERPTGGAGLLNVKARVSDASSLRGARAVPQVVLIEVRVHGAQLQVAHARPITMPGWRQIAAICTHAPITAEVLRQFCCNDPPPNTVVQVALHVPQMDHACYLEAIGHLLVGAVARAGPLSIAAPASVGLVEQELHLLHEHGLRVGGLPQQTRVRPEVRQLAGVRAGPAQEQRCLLGQRGLAPGPRALLHGQLAKGVLRGLCCREHPGQGHVLQRQPGPLPQVRPLHVLSCTADLREQGEVALALAPLHLRQAALQGGLGKARDAGARGGLVDDRELGDVHPSLGALALLGGGGREALGQPLLQPRRRLAGDLAEVQVRRAPVARQQHRHALVVLAVALAGAACNPAARAEREPVPVGVLAVLAPVVHAVAQAVAARYHRRLAGDLRQPHVHGILIAREHHSNISLVRGPRGSGPAGNLPECTEREAVPIATSRAVGTSVVHTVPQAVPSWDHRRLVGDLLQAYASIPQAWEEHPDTLVVLAIPNTRPPDNLALHAEEEHMAIWCPPIGVGVEDTVTNAITPRDHGWFV